MAASTSVNFTIVVAVNSGAVGWNHDHEHPGDRQRNGNEPGNAKQHLDRCHGARRRSFDDASRVGTRLSRPARTITYTETVTNNGPNAATGAVLYQQTPPNTTFSSMTPPAGWTCGTTPASGGTGTVLCSATGTLAANTTSGSFTYVVTVAGCHGGRHHHRQFRRRDFDNHRSGFIQQHHVHVRAGGNHRRFGPGDFHDRRADAGIRLFRALIHDSGHESWSRVRRGCNCRGYGAGHTREPNGDHFARNLRRGHRRHHHLHSRHGGVSARDARSRSPLPERLPRPAVRSRIKRSSAPPAPIPSRRITL